MSTVGPTGPIEEVLDSAKILTMPVKQLGLDFVNSPKLKENVQVLVLPVSYDDDSSTVPPEEKQCGIPLSH